jgi:tyrosine-protein kinase Etk/Wzc
MADIVERRASQQPPMPVTHRYGQEEVSLAGVARALIRARRLIAGLVLAGVIAAIGLTLLQTPEYESEATIQIHAQRASRGSGLAELGPAIGLPGLVDDAGGIETDMLVMTSRRIVEHVVDSLSLHVQVVEPPVARSDVFSVVRAPRDVSPLSLELRRDGSAGYRVRVESASASPPHPEMIKPGEPFLVHGVELALREQPDVGGVDRMSIVIRPFRDAVEAVRSELEVARAGRGTQIVTVAYRNRDPVIAAAVPNAIMDAFIHHKNETNKAENRSRANFLRQQVAHYEVELTEAETRLREFRERQQIISIQDQATEQVRRFAQLQSRRDELQEERDALRRLLSRVQTESAGAGAEDAYRQLASFPVFFANPTIQNIIRSLIDLENSRAQLMVRRTEENIDVQGIDKRIDELESQLLETAENYLESRENQMASLDATLAEFAHQAVTVPAREVEFARLSEQRELLGGIHQQLQMRLHEVEVEEAVEPMYVQLLDPALVAEDPASPRPLLNVVLGAMLGMGLALMLLFVRQALDTKVRSRADVQLAAGGLPILAAIPRNASVQNRSALRIPQLPFLRRPQSRRVDSAVVARDEPLSVAAEAYRALRTRLFLRRSTAAPSTIVIISAVAGEGKSTSAANLAVALAQQGSRTLLIDGDLRKGRQHDLFAFAQSPGLAEFLRGERPLAGLVHSLQLTDGILDVLPAGRYPPNPAELIGGAGLASALAHWQESYEHIVVDTPPLSLAADAAVLCSYPHTSALVVARAGFSDRDAIEHVHDELTALGIRIDGVIVTEVPDADAPAYGYQPALRNQ